MTDQLEMNILKKQNTELAMKIQSYRKQNRQLQGKNEELEVWVTNFAAIVSALEASMRVFSQNEESLYALMKRSDLKEKSCLNKYTQHFKTFNDILTNLPDRIKDSDRSNQLTAEIKTRIEASVKAYEVFFKDFVDQYFRFTDQTIRWATETLEKPDLPDIFRKIGRKELEYRSKMKEVQQFIDEQRGKYSQIAAHNETVLLGELLRKEQLEVKRLSEANHNLTRKFRLMMDYNSESVDGALSQDNPIFECSCGGAQLAYFKKEWDQKLHRDSQPVTNGHHTAQPVNTEEVLLLQIQIEELRKNSTNYLERYEKAKIERNIEEAVLKSHAFKDLLNQCQELIRYSNTLQEKLRLTNERIVDIERSRQRELRELKRRYDTERLAVSSVATHNINLKIIGRQIGEFKSDLSKTMAPVKQLYEKSVRSEEQNMEIIKGVSNNVENLRRDNDDLRRKVQQLESNTKPPEHDFKHEAHRKLMKDIESFLPKDDPKILDQFTKFVKSREKKASFLQVEFKKKEKQLSFKANFIESLTKALSDTEALYLQSKGKVQKLNSAIKVFQDDILKLTEENLEIKSNFDNEKTLLNMRLKSQSDINAKHQEKIKTLMNSCHQLEMSKSLSNEYFMQQAAYLQEMKSKYEAFELEHKNLMQECNLVKTKLLEYQKTQKRYILDNQSLRTKLNSIKKAETKKESMNTEEDTQMLLIELQNLRNKLYCSCKNDRQIEVSLKTCPHMFCKKCIDDVTTTRIRFCPLCKTKFSKTDVNYIKWN